MTLHLLDVAPRDVSADDLGLVVGGPEPDPLAELTVEHRNPRDAAPLSLRVLGSSHAVVIGGGGSRVVEQVSCEARRAGGCTLPQHRTFGRLRFASDIERVGPVAFERLAGRLYERAGCEPDWLCARFPGALTALTALTAVAQPAGAWRWRTWHLYPAAGGGTVVRTTSRWRP